MNKNPEELTCQDVMEFLLRKKEEGLKVTTLNLYNSAIRFFFSNVLHILLNDITVPRMITEHKLTVVLYVEEINRLLDATKDLKYKAMFEAMYSSGMRVSEVFHLHYDDISCTNMQIHIHTILLGGGLTSRNKWKDNGSKLFLPIRVISKVFRGKYLDDLKYLWEENSLIMCLSSKDSDYIFEPPKFLVESLNSMTVSRFYETLAEVLSKT